MAHQRSPPQACPKLIAQDEIDPLTRGNIDKLREVREKVVRNVSLQAATYKSVVTPLADAQHAIEDSYGVIEMLKYAAPDDCTRQASEEANHLWDQAWSEFNNDHNVYLLLQAVKDRNKDLEAEHAKYLDELLADFLRCVHGRLPHEGIVDFLERRNRIDSLRNEYTRNIREASGGMWFAEADLDGVLEQDRSRFRNATTRDSDDCFVKLTYSDFSAVMRYAKDSDVRKRLYVVYYSKNAENRAILKNVMMLRDQNARQLGYSSHAAYRLERRLAKSTQWVYNFLDQLEESLYPKAVDEVNSLLVTAGALHDGNEGTTVGTADTPSLPPWDYPYLKRLALTASLWTTSSSLSISRSMWSSRVCLISSQIASRCTLKRFVTPKSGTRQSKRGRSGTRDQINRKTSLDVST